jgi:hypothetical protein
MPAGIGYPSLGNEQGLGAPAPSAREGIGALDNPINDVLSRGDLRVTPEVVNFFRGLGDALEQMMQEQEADDVSGLNMSDEGGDLLGGVGGLGQLS